MAKESMIAREVKRARLTEKFCCKTSPAESRW